MVGEAGTGVGGLWVPRGSLEPLSKTGEEKRMGQHSQRDSHEPKVPGAEG